LKTGDSVVARSIAGSTTNTPISATFSALRYSCISSIDPGQSRIVQFSPRYVIAPAEISVLICRARASADESPTVFPSFTDPLRSRAPAVNKRLSRSVVLPPS